MAKCTVHAESVLASLLKVIKLPSKKCFSFKIRVRRILREKINQPVSQKDLLCKDVAEMSHLGAFVHH